MFVLDNRNAATGDRQYDFLANNALIALIRRMHRNRHISQHGFRTGGGDFDVVAAIVQGDAIGERIFEVPEMAGKGLLLNFQIGNRGFQLRVPIDQPLVAVKQAIVVKIDKYFEHSLSEVLVHGELFAAPVHRTAQAAQLAGDCAAGFLFPLPDFRNEVLARIVGALVLPLLHLPLDHHLRRDPGMVRADNP